MKIADMTIRVDAEEFREAVQDLEDLFAGREPSELARLAVFAWRLAVLFSLWLLIALQACCAPTRTHLRTPAEQRAAAVSLVAPCGTTASGVILDEHTLLTAAHFPVRCPARLYVATDAEGVDRLVELEAVSDRDVARLRVMRGQAPFKTGARPRLGLAGGAVCFEAGSPARGRSCGTVTAATAERGGIAHTAPTEKGNSGSGMYDARGRLVGIVVTCSGVGGVCDRTGGGASAPVVE